MTRFHTVLMLWDVSLEIFHVILSLMTSECWTYLYEFNKSIFSILFFICLILKWLSFDNLIYICCSNIISVLDHWHVKGDLSIDDLFNGCCKMLVMKFLTYYLRSGIVWSLHFFTLNILCWIFHSYFSSNSMIGSTNLSIFVALTYWIWIMTDSSSRNSQWFARFRHKLDRCILEKYVNGREFINLW